MRRLFGRLLAASMASFGLVLAGPGSPAVAGEICFIAPNGAGDCYDGGLGGACPGGGWVVQALAFTDVPVGTQFHDRRCQDLPAPLPVNRDAMAAFLYRYHNAFPG